MDNESAKLMSQAIIGFLTVASTYVAYRLKTEQTITYNKKKNNDENTLSQIKTLSDELAEQDEMYTEASDLVREITEYCSISKTHIMRCICTGDAGRDLLAFEYIAFRLNTLRNLCSDMYDNVVKLKQKNVANSCMNLNALILNYYNEFTRKAYNVRELVGFKSETSNKVFEHSDYQVLDIWATKYKERSVSKEDVVLQVIESLDCDCMENCIESLKVMTNTISIMLRLTIRDCQSVSCSLNGDLTGKVFLGLVIGDGHS